MKAWDDLPDEIKDRRNAAGFVLMVVLVVLFGVMMFSGG
jgi:hypothetical protein